MRFVLVVLCSLAFCGRVFAAATNQLYTGVAYTVPPGQVQLQAYYDSTFGGPQRLAGASFTFGAAKQLDARLGYGYLWNNLGPDVKLGPNVGVKWRVIGDGLRKPSVAFSSLYAINSGSGGRSHKNDFGELLIVQYPIKPMLLVGNYGHVWVGDDNASDLEYFSFAAIDVLSPRTLVALEYSLLDRVRDVPQAQTTEIIAGGIVYSAGSKLSYSAQLAYLPRSSSAPVHLTLGISMYL